MKKILFALCTLMIVPTLALASGDMVSISELCQQVEAMGRWTASYEAYKREIEVDIPIDMPEVDAVPIVQVSGYYAVDQEGRLTRDGTKLNRIGYDGFDIYEEDGLLMYLGTTCANGEIKAALFEQDKSVLLLAYYNSPSNLRTHKVKYDSKVYYPYEVDADEIYAEDNPQSAAEAKAYLERILGYFYPESDNSIALRYLEVRSRGHKVKGLDDHNLGEYAKDYPMGTYVLSIRQMMEGIPIYKDVGEKLSPDLTRKKPELWKRSVRIAGVKNNDFRYMDSHRFGLNSIWLKRQEIQQEDVPIKPLNEILEQLESLIAKGNIRKVHALRFGYCVYFTGESSETYTLYPTWVCECDYAETAKFEFANIEDWISDPRWNYYNKMLMFNAQTGNVESLMIETQEEAYVPGIITWEDIQ